MWWPFIESLDGVVFEQKAGYGSDSVVSARHIDYMDEITRIVWDLVERLEALLNKGYETGQRQDAMPRGVRTIVISF